MKKVIKVIGIGAISILAAVALWDRREKIKSIAQKAVDWSKNKASGIAEVLKKD